MFRAAIFLWLRSNTHERKEYLLWVFDNRDSELYYTFDGAQHQHNKTAEIQEHQSPRTKQKHFVFHFASSSF